MARCIERATARPGVGPGPGSSAIPPGEESAFASFSANVAQAHKFRCADAARRDTSIDFPAGGKNSGVPLLLLRRELKECNSTKREGRHYMDAEANL
jgi:hypothetical protein